MNSAALLGAALMIAPPPAFADRDWDDHRGRGRHQRSYRDNGHRHHAKHHEHGAWCGPSHGYAYRRAPVYYAPRPYAYYGPTHHHHAAPRYYCEPCDHWYGTQVSFHYHVRHHHGIAAALLPAVIIGTVFGAIFAGY